MMAFMPLNLFILFFLFAVNTKAFLLKKEEDIREDELFFHRYY